MYNYLFYKSYQATVRSGNYGYMPELGAAGTVSSVIMLNAITLVFVVERLLEWDAGNWLRPEYKWFWVVAVMVSTVVFYLKKRRVQSIITRYDDSSVSSRISPVLIIFLYFSFSSVLMLVAAIFRNHGGPFK